MAAESAPASPDVALTATRHALDTLLPGVPSHREVLRVAAVLEHARIAFVSREDHARALLVSDLAETVLALPELGSAPAGALAALMDPVFETLSRDEAQDTAEESQDAVAVCEPLALGNELRALRGAPLVCGNVIFAAALEIDDAHAPLRPRGGLGTEVGARARRLRSFYHQGLLAWLRGTDSEAAARRLAEVFARMQTLAGDGPQRALWQVAAAFAELIEQPAWRRSGAVKRLLGQLDAELKRIAERGREGVQEPAPPALVRSLLYYVAVTPSPGPAVTAARARYDLAHAFMVPPAGHPDDPTAALALLNEILVTASGLMEPLGSAVDWPRKRAWLGERLQHVVDGLSLLGTRDLAKPLRADLAALRRHPGAANPPQGGWGAMAERLHAAGAALLACAGLEPGDPAAAAWTAEMPEEALGLRLEADLTHAEAVIRRLELAPLAETAPAPEEADGDDTTVVLDPEELSPAAFSARLGELSSALEQAAARTPPDGDRPAEPSVDGELLDEVTSIAEDIDGTRARLEQQLGAFRDGLQDMDGAIRELRDELGMLRAHVDAVEEGSDSSGASGTALGAPAAVLTALRERLDRLSRGVADLSELRGSIEGVAGESQSLLVQQARDNLALEQRLVRYRMQPLQPQLEALRNEVTSKAADNGKQVVLRLETADLRMEPEKVVRLQALLRTLLGTIVHHGVEPPHARVLSGRPPGCMLELRFRRRGADLDIGVEADCARPADAAMGAVEAQLRLAGGSLQPVDPLTPAARWKLRLPLAPRIATVLLVSVADQVFAVTLAEVAAVLQVAPGHLEGGRLEHQGRRYPVTALAEVLGFRSTSEPARERISVVLVQADGERRALSVDAIGERLDVVVRSVGPQLRGLGMLAGATILGDGRVAPVLDGAELVRRDVPSEPRADAFPA